MKEERGATKGPAVVTPFTEGKAAWGLSPVRLPALPGR